MNEDNGNTESDVANHRRLIDRVDRTIVALLQERVRLGLAVGRLKRAGGEPMRCAEREARILRQVREAAQGPLAPEAAARIFTLIIEETSAAQERSHG